MPAAFGAWCSVGGHVGPFHDRSLFDNESQAQEYARKYKHGKPVGRNELVEKFKALEIVNFDHYVNSLPYCDYCSWLFEWLEKPEEDETEHDWHMFSNEDCKLPCRLGLSRLWERDRTKGVYALNREAFAIHDAHRRKGRSSASNVRRHRTSGQKRSALRKDARNALRDFDSRE